METLLDRPWLLAAVLGCLLAPAAVSQNREPDDLASYLRAIERGPAPAREAAVSGMIRLGPSAIPPLGRLLLASTAASAEAHAIELAARRVLDGVASRASEPGSGQREAAFQAILRLARGTAGLPPRAMEAALEALSLLARTGTEVEAIESFLDRPGAAPAAASALCRIPGEAAESALLRMLERPRDRKAAIAALAGRGTPRAAAALVPILDSKDEQEASLARSALEREMPFAGDDWLSFVENRRGAPDEWVAKAYGLLLAAARPELRLAALLGWRKRLPGRDIEVFTAALLDSDAGVRREAALALASWSGAGEFLTMAYRDATGSLRGELLRVLAARDPARGLTLARGDARSADPAVRRPAISVLAAAADPADEQVLFAAAAAEDSVLRAEAGRGLAALARAKLSSGDAERGLLVLHRILESGTDTDTLREAIEWAGRAGSPSSLEPLAALAGDPALRENVAEARLQIATALPAYESRKAADLLTLVYRTSRDRARRRGALLHLQRLGVDPLAVIRKWGIVQEWHVLGPWPKAKDAEELGRSPFASGTPRTDQEVAVGGARLRWIPRTTADPDGLVDLTFLTPHENVSAFALTTFDWPEDSEALLLVGSDDGVAIWVNGELVHSNLVFRGVTVDEDRVKVALRKGRNAILLRVDQGGGDFGYCLRICRPDGEPVDWTRF